MKTITMYELLGLVKDGKAPKKIKYQNYIYEYQHRRDTENSFNYMCNENGKYLSRKYFIDNILNDIVEILKEEPRNIEVCGSWFTKSEYDKLAQSEEEKKIPEKLDIKQEKNCKNNWKWKVYGKEHSYNISTPQKIIADKVNEICDYLKSKGE